MSKAFSNRISLDNLKEHWNLLTARRLPNGEVIGVGRMAFTYALFVDIHWPFYRTRFCYELKEDAIAACSEWNGEGDPPGPWIKEKPSDRLGPGAIK